MTDNYNDISGPDFTDRIDQVLDYKCISRRQLASACGFSAPNIARWKTQGSLPDVAIGVKIADYLGVSLYWLVTGKTQTKEIPVDEKQLIETYRYLNQEDKDLVIALLKAISKKYVKNGIEGFTEVE